jgi:hypothetical protein
MAIVWPAFALFARTMLQVARLARMRFAAAREGRVDPRYYRVFHEEGEPPALAAGQSGALLAGRGRAYVALRGLHTAIHATSNKVMWRFRAFAASRLVLIAYWVVLGAGLVSVAG